MCRLFSPHMPTERSLIEAHTHNNKCSLRADGFGATLPVPLSPSVLHTQMQTPTHLEFNHLQQPWVSCQQDWEHVKSNAMSKEVEESRH